MNAAAARFLLGSVLALRLAAEPAKPPEPVTIRAVPSRPAPIATTILNGLEYTSMTDVAIRLGLKGTWTEPQKKLILADEANRAEFKSDSREVLVDGLRIFLGDKAVLRKGQLYVSRTDFERSLTPLLRPGLGVTVPPVPRVIALDAGHGGTDDGTENKALGLKEKVLTLDVAQRLKKLLEAAGYKVVMIRSDDQPFSPIKALDLAMRPDFANKAGADLFVSIHFNAAPKDTSGTEVFTYVPKAQHATDWWGGLTKDDPLFETTDEPANRSDHWSAVLAGMLHRELLRTLHTEDRGKKIAHWAVLKTLNCPGVLVEPAIISNEAEARRVAVPEYRQQIAEALLAGIRNYATALETLRTPAKPAATPAPAPASGPTTSK